MTSENLIESENSTMKTLCNENPMPLAAKTSKSYNKLRDGSLLLRIIVGILSLTLEFVLYLNNKAKKYYPVTSLLVAISSNSTTF